VTKKIFLDRQVTAGVLLSFYSSDSYISATNNFVAN